MQDRPTATELLAAVAGFLASDVREWAPPEKRFQILVAANVCAVVAREIEAGDAPSREDLALFRELLDLEPGDDAAPEALDDAVRSAAGELARAIRAGELDDRLDEAMGRLAEHVRRKLDVARPGYAD